MKEVLLSVSNNDSQYKTALAGSVMSLIPSHSLHKEPVRLSTGLSRGT